MIFGFIRKYLAVLGIGLLGASFLFGGWQYRRANDLEAALATERVALASTQAAITTLTGARDADIAELSVLRMELTASRGRMSQAVEELEELKRNEAMVQDDPALAEQLVNDRLGRLFVELACSTGADRADCQNPAAATGASE